MSEAYFEIPSDAGCFIASERVNMLFASVAHVYQSIGTYAGSVNCTITGTPQTPPLTSPHRMIKALKFHPTAAGTSTAPISGTTPSTDGVPVSASTTYSVSASLYVPVASRAARIKALDYDGGDTLGDTTEGDWVYPTADSWADLSVQHTTAGDAAALLYVVEIWDDDFVSNLATNEDYYLTAACVQAGSDATFYPSLRIDDDIELELELAVDNVAANNDFGGYLFSGNNGFWIGINAGNLRAGLKTTAGTHWPVFGAHTLTNGVKATVKVTRVRSSGLTTGYVDGASIGSSVQGAGAALLVDWPNARVGNTGIYSVLAADFYRLTIRDGIDGIVAIQMDAIDIAGSLAA